MTAFLWTMAILFSSAFFRNIYDLVGATRDKTVIVVTLLIHLGLSIWAWVLIWR